MIGGFALVVVLLAGCGSAEEADAPPVTAEQTTLATTTTEATTTAPEQTTVPTTTSTTVAPTTSTTVPTTTTAASGALPTWRSPLRVVDAPLDAPAAASDTGVVVVRATAQEPGIEAATEVWFSPDAIDWEPADNLAGVRLRSVTAGGPGFIAVGWADAEDPDHAGQLPPRSPAVWNSPDGRTWTEAPTVDLGPFPYGRMTDVASGPGGLLAAGETWDTTGSARPAVWSSADGLVWTLVPGDPLGTVDDPVSMQVAAGRGGVAAIGQVTPMDGTMPGPVLAWWSRDGVVWEQAGEIRSPAPDLLLLGDVVAFGSGFVLAGSQGAQVPLVWFSSDGRSWSEATPLPTRADTDSSFVHGLVTDGSVLVAVGDDVIFGEGTGPATGDASIWMSSDAIEWEQVPPEQLRGDAVLDASAAFSAVRVGADWIVLGTTWDRTEDQRSGIVWIGS